MEQNKKKKQKEKKGGRPKIRESQSRELLDPSIDLSSIPRIDGTES